MSGTLWIPGAERLRPSSAGGTITSTAPPRAVWHTVEADPGISKVWDSMQKVLTGKSAEPNLLYDPLTDHLGQWFPLNESGRALKNDGGTRTNRVGRVCIQIEVIARSAKPFTEYWKPGPNFRALMAAIRSWGIPDVWPSGPPPRFIASPPHNVPEDERSRTIWTTKGGHYGHSQIPANNHGDPGGISTAALFAAGGKPTPPTGGTPTHPTEDEMSAADVQQVNAYTERRLDDYFTWLSLNIKQQLAPLKQAVAELTAEDEPAKAALLTSFEVDDLPKPSLEA